MEGEEGGRGEGESEGEMGVELSFRSTTMSAVV